MRKKQRPVNTEEVAAVATIINLLDAAHETKEAMVRAAQLLDYVQTYNWLLPHSDEFTAKLLEHSQWIDRQRIRGDYPPGNTIKRPVSKPKLRKSSIGDIRKSRRSPTIMEEALAEVERKGELKTLKRITRRRK